MEIKLPKCEPSTLVHILNQCGWCASCNDLTQDEKTCLSLRNITQWKRSHFVIVFHCSSFAQICEGNSATVPPVDTSAWLMSRRNPAKQIPPSAASQPHAVLHFCASAVSFVSTWMRSRLQLTKGHSGPKLGPIVMLSDNERQKSMWYWQNQEKALQLIYKVCPRRRK